MAKRKEAMSKETKTETEPTVGKRMQKRMQIYNKKTKRWVFTDSKTGMAILLAKCKKRERDKKDIHDSSERAVKRVKRRVVSEPKIPESAPAPTLLHEEIIVHTGASLEFANLSLS